MNNKIKLGIVGYGNLGRGAIKAIKQNSDMQLEAVFTRRAVDSIDSIDNELPMVHISEILAYKDSIDVMIMCGGSATDLEEQAPMVAQYFNTVDSFDTHAKIPQYFDKVDRVAREANTLSLISTGWDPGLFSLMRLLNEAILPEGKEYTFWGKGVSQGHSDAIRRVEGVRDGKQYTIPTEQALELVRTGENPELSTREKHERVCYIVPEEGADLVRIENEIKNMPNYFAEYNTTVHFISETEMQLEHSGMPHGGFVIRTGKTGIDTKQRMEFSLKLGSNPEFTSSVLISYARAVYRLAKDGRTGACTVFDIPFGYLSPKSAAKLRQELL